MTAKVRTATTVQTDVCEMSINGLMRAIRQLESEGVPPYLRIHMVEPWGAAGKFFLEAKYDSTPREQS